MCACSSFNSLWRPRLNDNLWNFVAQRRMMSHFVVAGDAVVDGGDRRHARAPAAGQQRYHQLAHFVGISPLTMTDF